LLVVLVVILFLQTWRASIIPLLAVPVSVVGTFAVLHLLGYSINTLTLFGLVLAIGIVVDDAIVVVENVERHIEHGASPLEAAHLAMREVSGPIIAIALVLCAVFVPMAFMTGVTGQFYKQFAVTIAISTVISAINSLTLSPALAAKLLKPRDAAKDAPSRLIDRLFGWLFRPFNRFFKRNSERYEGTVSRALGRRGAVFVVYAVLLVGAAFMFRIVPSGFIPVQDKLYLIAGVKMPEGASIERTDAALKKMAAIAKGVDGVAHEVAFPGLNPLQFTNTPNSGVVFFTLDPFNERSRSAAEITAELNQKFSSIQEGFTFAFMPPPIQGLGNGSGWSLFVEDRTRLGYGELQGAVQAFQGAASQAPGLGFPISSYQANVPQLDVEVDRVKAKAQGVPLTELFDTLQAYLGSAYVNDFNMFGRTWQVIAQADGPFRDNVEDIANLRTRNAAGEMVPLGSMVQVKQSYGPDPVIRFNGYPAADLLGEADPRVLSSGEAMAKVTALAQQVLPHRHGDRMERPELPAGHPGQGGDGGVPAGGAAGLPGAGRAVRKLDPAAGGDPDRADDPAVRAVRRVAGGRRQQRVRAGRPGRADGAGVQERDPDRRVRARAGTAGQGHRRVRIGGLPPAPAADRDDLGRVHRRHRAAGALAWRRCGSALDHRHHRVRRHARRDPVRPVPDPGVLRGPAQAGQPSVGLARAACDRGSGACLIDVDSLISPSSTFS
jgi:multidrug efflux pump